MLTKSSLITALMLVAALYGPGAGNKTSTSPAPTPPAASITPAPTRRDAQNIPFTETAARHICVALGKSIEQCAANDDPRTPDAHRIAALIATVPDPINTHLPLFFDRAIETLQRAGNDGGFDFVQFWFPWKEMPGLADADPVKRHANQAEKKAREDAPGFLLFRTPTTAAKNPAAQVTELVVFLVTESPTKGINRVQFGAAAKWIRHFAIDRKLRIVGPTFSGSLIVLQNLLSEWCGKALVGPDACATVASGSVTNPPAIARFSKAYSLLTTIHDDAYARDGFLETFSRALSAEDGGQCRYAAILSEDETIYGNQFNTRPPHWGHCDPKEKISPLLIRFPRDMWRIRNAYKDNSSDAKSARPSELAAKEELPLRLQDTQTGDDSVPSFSVAHSPVSEETELLNIAQTLKREGIRYVAIAATDVLDAVFLSKFLRLACPNIRLVLLDADLLFHRAAADYPFNGMLAVTTYPLFSENEHWTRPRAAEYPPRRIVFPNRYAEGTYNAARMLLRDYVSSTVPLSEYTAPNKATNQPALWLTTLTRSGYWPVSLLVEHEPENGTKITEVQFPDQSTFGFSPSRPSPAWKLVASLLLLIVIAHAALMLAANRWRSRWLELFSIREGQCDRNGRAAYLLCASLALAVQAFVLLTPLWIVIPRATPDTVVMVVVALVAFLLLVISLVRNFGQMRVDWKDPYFWMAGAALLLSAGVLTCWSLVIRTSTDLHGEFAAYRSLHLFSGVSPVIPPLALLAALYVWSLIQAQRLRIYDERQLLIPTREFTQHGLCEDMGIPANELEKVLLNPIPFSGKAVGIIVGIYAFLVVVIIRPWLYLGAFEAAPFRVLCSVMLLVLYLLIIFTWLRFLWTWKLLKDILQRLDRLPLRHAFSALPKEYSRSPLSEGRLRNRSHVLFCRSLDALRALLGETSYAGPVFRKDYPAIFNPKAIEDSLKRFLERCGSGKCEDEKNIRDLQDAFLFTSEKLLEHILVPAWVKGSVETESEGAHRIPPNEAVVIASEFVAFRFLAYIRYVFLQMRNLLTFVLTAFVLSCIGLFGYPFDAGETLVWAATVLFVVLIVPVAFVFAQVSRDAIMSRITRTEAGKLDKSFAVHLAAAGAVPLLTVLASQFPSVGRLLYSWLQPAIETLR